jgi:hypothetical protein
MRELLRQPETQAALAAMQRPLADVRSDLTAAMGRALQAAKQLAAEVGGAGGEGVGAPALSSTPSLSTAVADVSLTRSPTRGGAGAPVRWVAIAGFDDGPLRQMAAQLLGQEMAGKVS